MQETTFDKERELALAGHRFVVGIDEAGRGPLAGSVVAAAVALKTNDDLRLRMNEKGADVWKLVRDSKTLSEKQREKASVFIHERFFVGVGIIGAETIDRVNILQATFLAMKAALAQLLKKLPHEAAEQCYLLVDGNQEIPNCSSRQEAVVGGDGIAKSIAAASIVAKVTRDRMIVEADTLYPGYGFARHKGYGTAEHMDALRRLGPCPIHRMSFDPVKMSLPENVNRRYARDIGRRGVSRMKRRPAG